MKNLLTKAWVAAVITGVLVTACSKSPSLLPIDGQIKNGVYTNAFFAFTFKLPTGWTATNLEYTASMRKEFSERIYKAVGPENSDAKQAANFFGKGMTSLLLIERTNSATGTKELISFASMPCTWKTSRMSASDIIASGDRGLTSRTPPATRVGEISEVSIGGRVFVHASYSKPAHGLVFRQDYFVATFDGQALFVILTAFDEHGLESEASMLKTSLKFSEP